MLALSVFCYAAACAGLDHPMLWEYRVQSSDAAVGYGDARLATNEPYGVLPVSEDQFHSSAGIRPRSVTCLALCLVLPDDPDVDCEKVRTKIRE